MNKNIGILSVLLISASIAGCGSGGGSDVEIDPDVENSMIQIESTLPSESVSTPESVPVTEPVSIPAPEILPEQITEPEPTPELLPIPTPEPVPNFTGERLLGGAEVREYNSLTGITVDLVEVKSLSGDITMELILTNMSRDVIYFAVCDIELIDGITIVDDAFVSFGGLFTQINPNEQILGMGDFPIASFDNISTVNITCRHSNPDLSENLDITNGPLKVSFLSLGKSFGGTPTILLMLENTSGTTFDFVTCNVKAIGHSQPFMTFRLLPHGKNELSE